MAKMIPDLSEEQLRNIKSKAEEKVYRALKEQLSDEYTVLSHVSWILKKQNDKARDGETDFVVCHPNKGYLCIEIKGGGVSFEADSNKWFSIDRNNNKNPIKNPIEQVIQAKYSILSKLNENSKWTSKKFDNIIHGHAVFFPDIHDATSMSSAEMPLQLIGVRDTLNNMKRWIKDCFKLWGNKNSNNEISFGEDGIQIITDIFARTFCVKPLLSIELQNDEEKRIKLTNNQIGILDTLCKRRHAVVSGGAGTGKTVLAVEKAKRLAKEGFKTLLTCYNRPLANYLNEVCKDVEGLSVMTFHQLCELRITQADKESGRHLLAEAKETYPGESEFDVQKPSALIYSMDILTDNKYKYEAIVCDEGQDFREEFWIALQLLLTDEEKSPFYIFYDDNQNLYSRASSIPFIKEGVYPLLTNCRNTAQIHKISYKFYKGEPVNPPDIDGYELELEIYDDIEKQAQRISDKIVELINSEKIDNRKITVLIADSKYKEQFRNYINKYLSDNSINFTEDEQRENDEILLTTVKRFKGLESDIIFLWGLDFMNKDEFEKHVYVGASRAKSILIIVGNYNVCEKFKQTV